jgi:hypothetical protein
MRKEYDFSGGKRGKHVGKRIRIVGDECSQDRPKTSSATQQVSARNLKRPEVSDDTSVKRKP